MIFLLGMVAGRMADSMFSDAIDAALGAAGDAAVDQVTSRLRAGAVGLPENHDLERGHRDALRRASLHMLGTEAMRDLPRHGRLQRARQMYRRRATASLDLDRGGDLARWCQGFEDAVRDDSVLSTFDGRVTLAPAELETIASAQIDAVVLPRFHQEYLSWLDGLGLGETPAAVRVAVTDGWVAEGSDPEPPPGPVAGDGLDGSRTEVRITVYGAYCLWFQDLIAKDDVIRRKVEMNSRYLAGRAVHDAQQRAHRPAVDPGTAEDPTWAARAEVAVVDALRTEVGPALERLGATLTEVSDRLARMETAAADEAEALRHQGRDIEARIAALGAQGATTADDLDELKRQASSIDERLTELAEVGREGRDELALRNDAVACMVGEQAGTLLNLLDLGVSGQQATAAVHQLGAETLAEVRALRRDLREAQSLADGLRSDRRGSPETVANVIDLLRRRVLWRTEFIEVPIRDGGAPVRLPMDHLAVGTTPVGRSRASGSAAKGPGDGFARQGPIPPAGDTDGNDTTIGGLVAADGAGRMLLIGGPGTGKSTILRWMARAEATAGRPVVLVACRDLRGDAVDGNRRSMVMQQVRTIGSLSDAVIERVTDEICEQINQGRITLLVDGLDELAGGGSRFVDEVSSWLGTDGSRARVGLTSRGDGTDASSQRLAHALRVEDDRPAAEAWSPLVRIQNLGPAPRQHFVDAWAVAWRLRNLSPVESILARDLRGSDEDLSARYHDLRRTVADKGDLSDLASTVLTLSLVAQAHEMTRDGGGRRLPQWRRELYQQLVELLVERQRSRTRTGGLESPEVHELGPRLEVLALHMVTTGTLEISEDVAAGVIRRFDESFDPRDLPAVRARRPANELIEEALTLGLVVECGLGPYRRGIPQRLIAFFHPSFQEYFAGRALHHAWEEEIEPSPAELGRTLGARLAEAQVAGRQGEPGSIDPTSRWFEVVRHCIESVDGTPYDPGMAPDPRGEPVDELVRSLLATGADTGISVRALAEVAVQSLTATTTQTVELVGEVLGHALLDIGPQMASEWSVDVEAAVARVLSRLTDREVLHLAQSMPPRSTRRFGGRMIERLIEDDSEAGPDAEPATVAESAPALLEVLRPGSSASLLDQTRATLDLVVSSHRDMNVGRNDDPDQPEQRMPGVAPTVVADLLDSLLGLAERGDAVGSMATWAATWLVGAPLRRGDAAAMTDSVRRRVRDLLARPSQDPHMVADLALLLSVGATPQSFGDHDWIYRWALVADGEDRQADLPRDGHPEPGEDAEAVIEALRRLGPHITWRGAIAAARLGRRDPFLVPALFGPMRDPAVSDEDRDEPLYFVTAIGGQEATSRLVELARRMVLDRDDPLEGLATRALLALVGMGDVDAIVEFLGDSDSVAGYDKAYLRSLATCHDPRGREMLWRLSRHHPSAQLRRDAAAILEA